jgi:two-component system sensor histidine kinase ChvG
MKAGAFRPKKRASLRWRVFGAVSLAALAPLFILFLSSRIESNIDQRLKTNLASALLSLRGQNATEAEMVKRAEHLAKKHAVWILVVNDTGRILVDANQDAGRHPLRKLGALFYGPDGAPTIEAFHAGLEPILTRPEVRRATSPGADPILGCRSSDLGRLLVCHGALRVEVQGNTWVLYAQESSRRAIRGMVDLRYQLAKLVLFSLPLALLLAWWLTVRVLQPIQRLRDDARQKTQAAGTTLALPLTGQDELGELTAAFNALLATVEEKAKRNEVFVADLAHELKNPVAAIFSAAEQLADQEPDVARQKRLAEVLQRSSKRLDALVTEILELARAESGLLHEEREAVDLAALCGRLVEDCAASHPEMKLSVEKEDGDFSIQGIPVRLESALRNLIENALSFCGEGGHVKLALSAGGGEVEIAITDTGPGIATENLPRVFDRFFTTRPKAEGTGLGLAMVKAVAEAHGGRVTAENQKDGGARFALTLRRGS